MKISGRSISTKKPINLTMGYRMTSGICILSGGVSGGYGHES